MHKQKPKTRELAKEKQMLSFKNGSRSKGLYEILTKQQKDTKKLLQLVEILKAFQLLLIENYQNWLKRK
jgi:hypothetical protein